MTDRVVVGRIRGLHGLEGHVRVEVLTDRPEERFTAGAVVFREGHAAALTIRSAAPVADGPGWRLAFDGIPDRNAAESLRDAYLEMAVDRAEALGPGEVFWHEVVGARVIGGDGRELGRVADVYRAGVAEVYVVRGGPAGEFDLPAIRDVITEFAPERGELVVDEAFLALGEAPVDQPRARPRPKRPRWSRHGKGRAGMPPPDSGTPPPADDEAPLPDPEQPA